MTDGSTNEPAEQAKKPPRKSRTSEPASDDPKAGSSDQDPVQDSDDGAETEKDEGSEQSGAAPTKSESPVAEKHGTPPHAGTEPAKRAVSDGDKASGSSTRSVYTRFRRRRR
jgi:hypothetical protein